MPRPFAFWLCAGGLALTLGGCAAERPTAPEPVATASPEATLVPQAAPQASIAVTSLAPPGGAPAASGKPAPSTNVSANPPAAQTATAPVPREFQAWLREFRAEARRAGISERTAAFALDGIAPIPRVIELDRAQPETTRTFQEYMARVINDQRVSTGRERLRQHAVLLRQVADKYKVPPRFVVALWAAETDFGRVTGGFQVVPALATLAWEGRRAAFFRAELMNALKIIDAGHISAADMKGSWAGAMGQSQFMPSSFLSFAEDWNGDGKRDIWRTESDVFASISNYLAKSGWRPQESWGREVSLTRAVGPSAIGLDKRRPLSAWAALGLRRADGKPLVGTGGDAATMEASLIQFSGPSGPAYLVYENFRTILKWNRSNFFAVSVGTLADRFDPGSSGL
jgi:membrane-bound lytic murein transglycosylase B